jgi:arylsulfatase A-like enzyme
MSFTGFAATQQTAGMGYLDAAGSPSEALTAELGRIDASISRIVDALREKDLLNSTWIIVVSPCAEAPMRPQQRREIPLSAVQAAVEGTRSGLIAHISGGGVARIWLVDPSKTKIVVRVLNTAAESLGIRDIDAGRRLSLTLNSPQSDPRRPDIVLHGEAGVIWTRGSRHPAMIGGGDDDESTHVALLVSGPQFMDRSDPTWVPNTQIAPLLLRALGLEKFDLQALHREHTPALPGIF